MLRPWGGQWHHQALHESLPTLCSLEVIDLLTGGPSMLPLLLPRREPLPWQAAGIFLPPMHLC